MASLNKVILLGNLGRPAELKYTATGTAQAKFSLATSQNRKGKDGNWTEETSWHNVVLWGEQAERLQPQLDKGATVTVEGRISYRTWDDDAGVKHYATEIVADRVMLVGPRKATAAQDLDPDDLPFD